MLAPPRSLKAKCNNEFGVRNRVNEIPVRGSKAHRLQQLYAHFGDKAQLFRAVIEYWMEELPEPALPCEVTGELRDCLEAVARELLQQRMHPAFLVLTNILLRSNWVPQKRWRQRYRPYQAYLETVLSQSARCNDPVRAAGQFLLLAVGSIDCCNLIPVNESRVSAAVELFVQVYM